MIELLITMSIMSIILGLSCASLNDLVVRNKNQCFANRLFASLSFARTEAIKRNKVVAICGSDDFQHCKTDWSNGYMVFVTDKDDNAQSINILRVEKAHHSQMVNSNNQTVIKYSGDGKCLTRSTIHIADSQKIVIYDSGRARLESVVP